MFHACYHTRELLAAQEKSQWGVEGSETCRDLYGRTANLIEALNNGTLSGAGLDVFEEQPLSPKSPLWHMPTVYITPHCTPQVPDRRGYHCHHPRKCPPF